MPAARKWPRLLTARWRSLRPLEAGRGILDTGYRILDAGDGDEALRVAQNHEGPIHLLLTDLVMPGMNGKELAQRLEGLRPEAKVLYMSGYAGDILTPEGAGETDGSFLAKPFRLDSLAAKVREVLGSATV